MSLEQQITQALSSVMDEDFKQDIVSLEFVKSIEIDNERVMIEIELDTPASPTKEFIRHQIHTVLKPLIGKLTLQLKMSFKVKPIHDLQGRLQVPGVSHVILIGSGKGGVGKSTLSVNLAAALSKAGAKVGLLDADIYGPSAPILLKPEEGVSTNEDQTISPAVACGIRYMSMGFLAQKDAPLIWRGPMAHKAIQQCLFDTKWGDLDYLLVDLPPGTGDVHLTLAQTVRVSGAVIISTPQDLGLTISKKTLRMFEKTDVPILGMIENMSFFVCDHCNEKHYIFGDVSVESDALALGVPFFGQIGINSQLVKQTKTGIPVVMSEPNSEISKLFHSIAGQIAKRISITYYQPTAA